MKSEGVTTIYPQGIKNICANKKHLLGTIFSRIYSSIAHWCVCITVELDDTQDQDQATQTTLVRIIVLLLGCFF